MQRGVVNTTKEDAAAMCMRERVGLGTADALRGSSKPKFSSFDDVAPRERHPSLTSSAPIRFTPAVIAGSNLPGEQGDCTRRMQKFKLQNSKCQKIEKSQKTKSSNLSLQFFPRDRSRSILLQDRILVLKISGKAFASSLLVRKVRGAYLMRASSVPMKRRHLPG
jgi:hypothetical protein